MRKITTGLLVAAASFTLAACGEAEAPVVEATTEAAMEAAPMETGMASDMATDASAAMGTETADANGNPIQP